MEWGLLLISAFAAYIISYLYRLTVNYYEAKKTGFPVVVCPVDPNNIFVMVLGPAFLHQLSELLPTFIWSRIRYALHGWEYIDTIKPCPTPGNAFVTVTPSDNSVWISDPEMIQAIHSRKKDFYQAKVTQKLIGAFGPNVMTVDGNDWTRHRKIVAQGLSERIMKKVWNDTRRQADEMLDFFMQNFNGRTNKTIDGLRQIAINVLAATGYGESPHWNLEHESEAPPPGHKLSYIQVIIILSYGFTAAAFIPVWMLCLNFLPKVIRDIGVASSEFPVYTKEKLKGERELADQRAEPSKTFLSTLVELSDQEKQQGDPKSSQFLTEAEIQGNLWQFSLAGYDTTSNTLAYAVTLLAIYPEWLDWVTEEVDEVAKGGQELDYEDIFPKLKKCLAIMYETLRVYTPVNNPGRRLLEPQTLVTSSGSFYFPTDMRVYSCLARIHKDPQLWGEDALKFRPSRWLEDDEVSKTQISLASSGGKFIPWSTGARICPGMKMAQVEFVSAFYYMFSKYSVKPALQGSETMQEARDRLKGVVRDSQPRLTLQMKRPEDVNLVWEKRR